MRGNLLKRWLILLLGLALSGFGVAFSARVGLGTSPISSLPFVLTYIFPLSFGVLTFALNLAFVLAQALILRKDFSLFQLLQIPALLVFSLFIDLGMFCSGPLLLHEVMPMESSAAGNFCIYVSQHAELFLGSVVLAFGIALQILSNLLLMPADALARVAAEKWHFDFSRVKMSIDGSMVCAAFVLTVVFLHQIYGLREGTLLAVFYVGGSIHFILPRLRKMPFFDSMLT